MMNGYLIELGNMEEQSDAFEVEIEMQWRLPVRDKDVANAGMPLLCRVSSVVCSTLKLVQAQSAEHG